MRQLSWFAFELYVPTQHVALICLFHNQLVQKLALNTPVWPIWAIFESLGDKYSNKQSPNTFWAILKSLLFRINYCGYFLGNFWENLGNFLFQHLVTMRDGPNRGLVNIWQHRPRLRPPSIVKSAAKIGESFGFQKSHPKTDPFWKSILLLILSKNVFIIDWPKSKESISITQRKYQFIVVCGQRPKDLEITPVVHVRHYLNCSWCGHFVY